jgi:hypothetical protein
MELLNEKAHEPETYSQQEQDQTPAPDPHANQDDHDHPCEYAQEWIDDDPLIFDH